MSDAPPRHVANMENSVNTPQVDERAVASDILDHTLQNHPLLQDLEDLFLQHIPLFFHQNPARNNHVAARAIVFQDSKLFPLAEEFIEITRRPEIHMRARKESGHAHEI